MSKIGKTFALILILIMTISSIELLVAKHASAQSIGNLTAPTFTVTLTNTSYSTPPSHYVDPQTGANITVPGSFVNQENLTFTIQNQPDVTYYIIRWTTPYMKSWSNIEGYIGGDPMNATVKGTSGSTTIWVLTGNSNTFPIYENGSLVDTVAGFSFPFGFQELNFENGAKIEFQVQASNGSPTYVSTILDEHFSIIGEISDWSSTQTITIPSSSAATSPSPITITTPAVPELSWLMIMLLLLSVFSVAVIVRRLKNLGLDQQKFPGESGNGMFDDFLAVYNLLPVVLKPISKT